MIDEFSATDVIAILTMIGYFVLLFLNKGTELAPAVAIMIGYYFGKKNQLMTNRLS